MSSLISSPILPLRNQFPGAGKDQKTRASGAICAMRRSEADYGSGRLVDENLIVLRMRIHEMKMIERNYEPPTEWMDWEKSFYTSYDSMICEAMGVLQSQLMNTRPSLALGMIALVTLSVPISTGLGMFHLLELTRGVLAGIHMLG
ncbi:hypothetical protein M9H77_08170 [Catharanthus roseus]|uniref:Uncharacterized protein n=1 Tax=Catharanthus roseus TaxID=4058 RepID=A0ACC0BX77_CATRO|nr:hypothetical protein M9H77_08170 [Catharanthus roseus]